ncbi:MAG: hypothetical protein ACI84C_001703 [Flavobacteriales bacterium]|jgi:hypothetical protein
MKVFESIKSFLSGQKSGDQIVPEGFCPNCWGRQEYEGEFFKAMKTEHIDTNNIDEKKGWIQGYAEKHLTGIQLKDKNGKPECSVCYVSEN